MKKILNRSSHFWGKVDTRGENDCWNWTASCFQSGYGNFWNGFRTGYSHRFAYEITFGTIPEGLCICHKCDNKRCCNPAHLFLGTYGDNTADSSKKNRCNVKKFYEGEIELICKLYDSGYSPLYLGKMFKSSHHTILGAARHKDYYLRHRKEEGEL